MIAIKPEVSGVKQLDDGIDDTFVSVCGIPRQWVLVHVWLLQRSRYESMGDTIVQLRGPYCSG
jgi:hypothetical protein